MGIVSIWINQISLQSSVLIFAKKKKQQRKTPTNDENNNKQWINNNNNKTTTLEQTAAEATGGLQCILLAPKLPWKFCIVSRFISYTFK